MRDLCPAVLKYRANLNLESKPSIWSKFQELAAFLAQVTDEVQRPISNTIGTKSLPLVQILMNTVGRSNQISRSPDIGLDVRDDANRGEVLYLSLRIAVLLSLGFLEDAC